MAETIPGGAFLSADGKTWHDSEGKPLSKEAQAAAEKFAVEQAQAQRDAEQDRTLLEAQRDPVARALLNQQQANADARKASK